MSAGSQIRWPSRKWAWSALAILSLANILSYLDRIIVNLLVDPIQADLAINDTQFGLLQGVAFGLFYAGLALPIGRLVDSGPRRRIIAIGVAVFSICSFLSGLSRTYWQLFLARVGVGAGEATVVPTSYSLLSDYFPPERLGRAISIFTMTAFVGIGLAYIAGGGIIAAITAWDSPSWLDGVAPWRQVFMLVALPGLIIVPLVMFGLSEPKRQGRMRKEPLPLMKVGAHLSSQRTTLIPLFAGFSMITMSGYASTVWTPALFVRTYDWSPQTVGYVYGAAYLALAPAGALLAGFLCDRLTARGVADAPLRVAAWGYIGTGFFGGLAPLMPTGELAMAVFLPTLLMATMPYPMAGTAIQLMTPNDLRGQVSALYMLVINLVGLGLGPLIVGLFSDFVFTADAGVRYSLALVNAACAPLAFFFLFLAMKPYRALRAGSS